jgi:hypothetical protein
VGITNNDQQQRQKQHNHNTNIYNIPELAQTASLDEGEEEHGEGRRVRHNDVKNCLDDKENHPSHYNGGIDGSISREIDVSLDMIRRDGGRSVIFRYQDTNESDTTVDKLTRVLNDTIRQSTASTSKGSTLFYYQGLHDIAGVVLYHMDYDEHLSKQIMGRICRSHLRDAMRENFHDLTWLLSVVLPPLMNKVDPTVQYILQVAQVDLANVCLPWIITWFAHDIHDPETAGRLLDAFLAGHPLMAMYFSVALIAHPLWKETLSNADCDDPASVFLLIKKMPSSLVPHNNQGNSRGRQTIPIQEILDDSISIMYVRECCWRIFVIFYILRMNRLF